MELGSLTSSLQINQVVDSASKKDQSGFAEFLQASRDAQSQVAAQSTGATTSSQPAADDPLRQAFQDFVGQTFFAELIKSYRSTQQPAAYFNGGRAEKIFQGQLDQMLSEQISKRSADKIADPMYERFMASRPS